jgi:selenoprotein W-related protein
LAARLLTLKHRIGALKLVPSRNGAFEVSVNGTKIHSKLETGQFPDPDTVVKAVKARLS